MNLVNWRLVALTGLGATLAFTTACDDKETTGDDTDDGIIIGGEDDTGEEESLDTAIMVLYNYGQGNTTPGLDGSLTGTSLWYAWGLATQEPRCIWVQEFSSTSPSSDCLDCTFAFDITIEAPYVYDGTECDDINDSLGGYANSDVVASYGTYRTGFGNSETADSLWRTYYGQTDYTVLMYGYGGGWYNAYFSNTTYYTTPGAYGYNFYWSEYWGYGYYYM